MLPSLIRFHTHTPSAEQKNNHHFKIIPRSVKIMNTAKNRCQAATLIGDTHLPSFSSYFRTLPSHALPLCWDFVVRFLNLLFQFVDIAKDTSSSASIAYRLCCFSCKDLRISPSTSFCSVGSMPHPDQYRCSQSNNNLSHSFEFPLQGFDSAPPSSDQRYCIFIVRSRPVHSISSGVLSCSSEKFFAVILADQPCTFEYLSKFRSSKNSFLRFQNEVS